MYKDSGCLNIKRWLQYVTIGRDAVNTFKNFDRFGSRSNIIATFPITIEQPLNNTVTYRKDVNFETPLNNGTLNAFTFYVNTNIPQKVKLYILMECFMKQKIDITIEQELRDLYYDPKTGYQPMENLYKKFDPQDSRGLHS